MKNNRHAVLLNLINENIIDTQDRLLTELKKHGFNVTQATISRDIKALNIVKSLDKNGNYRYSAGVASNEEGYDRYTDIFKKSTISITAAMNDVIIKCYSGTASAACAAIDSLFSDLFIGTLAGDDTILVITADSEAANKLVEKLNSILG